MQVRCHKVMAASADLYGYDMWDMRECDIKRFKISEMKL
jgi:hypothetical protein